MTFAWDENKSQANLAKHGVTFDAAKEIFGGPLLGIIDGRRDYGETRIAAIGVAHGVEPTVVYTRHRAKRRIISARRARRDERRHITRRTLVGVRDDSTCWERLAAMTEEEIDAAAWSDPDAHPFDAEFLRQAIILTPRPKKDIHMRVDADVLAWFKQGDKGYQARMNAVLRAYMLACSTRIDADRPG